MSDRNLYTLLPVNARNSIRLRRSEKRLLARTIASTERRIEDLMGEGSRCLFDNHLAFFQVKIIYLFFTF